MSTVDTEHTNRERLEKIALLIEHVQRIGVLAVLTEMPDGPGEVRTLLRQLRCEGETLVEFANESEACLKALLISDFITNVELPDAPDDGMITIPRVLFDSLNKDVQALRKQLPNSGWDLLP